MVWECELKKIYIIEISETLIIPLLAIELD